MPGGSRERTRDRDRRYRDRHSKTHHRRSPEYSRNYSSDEDSDSGRRHRSDYDSHDYESDRRSHHRRHRSRSRSRERSDRDSYRDRYNDEDEHYECGEDGYERDRSYSHQREKKEVPNNTIMIRGLPATVSEANIVSKLAEHGLNAKDIRLMRNKETGASRGFAFVEFTNLTEAVRWKELTQGVVNFDEEHKATIHYSIPKEALGDKNIMKNDWCCYKCGVNNFKRREQCFKCGTPKEESLANDTGDEISATPTNCLLFRSLSQQTTEERILTILGTMTRLPIKSIRILKDPVYNVSRGVCLVELHTTLEASELFTILSSIEFIIDDYPVSVNYGKRNSSNAQVSINAANAASIALAAAQWTNQKDDASVPSTAYQQPAPISGSLGTVTVKGVVVPKYPTPNPSLFQYDESSGYHYDSSTGFYFDSKSQYYYNPQTQKYLYWDVSLQTYLTVESDGSTSLNANANVIKLEEDKSKDKSKDKQDKVKIAKKIAKDMEKWAKTLNQKKESAAKGVNQYVEVVQDKSATSVIATADAGFSVFDKTQAKSDFVYPTTPESKFLPDNSATEVSMSYEEITEFINAEEQRRIDWDKLACLLCKRQFDSREKLNKHLQASDLHKNNINAFKRSKLTEEQLAELERNEIDRESYRPGTRDRAKERREKYGQPETPEPSKMRNKYMTEYQEADIYPGPGFRSQNQATAPVASENIGAKMLKKMGWRDGMGLGRDNQGMADIISVERRAAGTGLGIQASAAPASGDVSYKDAVRRVMQQRYKELSEK